MVDRDGVAVTVTLHIGDCREVMATLPAEQLDAMVTDPPYGLAFMGKAWDHGVPGVPFWSEALRVLKPGAHLLAFGGTRTYHRLACAIEDAGFEVRDCLMWLYGSGFPKSHNLRGEWDGWGTALKPAWEPVIMARKPLAGTVAANVARHGTGALNVDGCRVGTGDDRSSGGPSGYRASGQSFGSYPTFAASGMDRAMGGRWPANVVLDDDAAAALDAQSGNRPSSQILENGRTTYDKIDEFFHKKGYGKSTGYGDTGGASRFFYVAKASRSERNAGLDGLPEQDAKRFASGARTQVNGEWVETYSTPMPKQNHHPTVKPIALMRWLVRLVTPPGGTVLDPFMGSGTTGVACIAEGFRFIGIDREPDYVEIARRRIAHAQGPLFAEVTA